MHMYQDPYVIRLNMLHYQALLKLDCTPSTRQQLLKSLAKAQAELSFAEAERSDLVHNAR